MESVRSAEVEPRCPAETEGFLQAAVSVRNRDGHRGLRQIDVDLAVRRAREADGAGDGEDASGTDCYLCSRVDFASFVEPGGKLLDLGCRVELDAYRGLLAGFVDEPISVVILAVRSDRYRSERIRGQDDRLVQRLTRVVEANRDAAADRQSVEADKARFTVGIHGVARRG